MEAILLNDNEPVLLLWWHRVRFCKVTVRRCVSSRGSN